MQFDMIKSNFHVMTQVQDRSDLESDSQGRLSLNWNHPLINSKKTDETRDIRVKDAVYRTIEALKTLFDSLSDQKLPNDLLKNLGRRREIYQLFVSVKKQEIRVFQSALKLAGIEENHSLTSHLTRKQARHLLRLKIVQFNVLEFLQRIPAKITLKLVGYLKPSDIALIDSIQLPLWKEYCIVQAQADGMVDERLSQIVDRFVVHNQAIAWRTLAEKWDSGRGWKGDPDLNFASRLQNLPYSQRDIITSGCLSDGRIVVSCRDSYIRILSADGNCIHEQMIDYLVHEIYVLPDGRFTLHNKYAKYRPACGLYSSNGEFIHHILDEDGESLSINHAERLSDGCLLIDTDFSLEVRNPDLTFNRMIIDKSVDIDFSLEVRNPDLAFNRMMIDKSESPFDNIRGITVSPCDEIVTSSFDGGLQFWDSDGKPGASLPAPSCPSVDLMSSFPTHLFIKFLPDGRCLEGYSTFDSVHIRAWNPKNNIVDNFEPISWLSFPDSYEYCKILPRDKIAVIFEYQTYIWHRNGARDSSFRHRKRGDPPLVTAAVNSKGGLTLNYGAEKQSEWRRDIWELANDVIKERDMQELTDKTYKVANFHAEESRPSPERAKVVYIHVTASTS